MADSTKIYDITFKKMFRISNRMLIKFVNKVFKKDFSIEENVTFLDPNTEDENLEILEKDLYFEIVGERFQIEAQSYYDDMMFRLFEYAVNTTRDGYTKIDADHAEFRMPKQVVVFLKGTDKTKDKLHIKLVLPDEQEIEYAVPAVRALGYNPKELVENDMEILLPFQIIRMWNRVKDYNNYSENRKEQFLNEFEGMCNEIMITMDSLYKEERVSNDEYKHMLDTIKDLENHIYSSIEDIKKREADAMVQEKILLWSDQVKEEAANAKAKEIAKKMITNKEPADKIEEYTGLNLKALKEIAASIGAKLLL